LAACLVGVEEREEAMKLLCFSGCISEWSIYITSCK
jgi:hypothetical protein